MRTVSLFSGCGGLDMGAERAGAELVFANDNMPEAAETHARYFPEAEFRLQDIHDVRRFPPADLVIGGYPCQSFSMGGNRNPSADRRTLLYQEFARCLEQVRPAFFVAENVSGLRSLEAGRWLQDQLDVFSEAGKAGYNVAWRVLRAEEYGVPQRRKRLFLVGVRRDVGRHYWFPAPTHGSEKEVRKFGVLPYESHGDALECLPLWPTGEFYERPHDPEGHWSWYYMSRNRKAPWDGPSFTVVANFRHTPLHPASCTMRLVWSNLADGWKQKWEFTGEYEHLAGDPDRPVLDQPRRLSWREAAAIQTFPRDFEPAGNLGKKFEQIGNAVPVRLAEAIVGPLVSGSRLRDVPQAAKGLRSSERLPAQLQLAYSSVRRQRSGQ